MTITKLFSRCAADCIGMDPPHLPGFIVLVREPGSNAYSGVVENSFSLGQNADRTQFYWSSDNATSNFGGRFKVDGRKMAEDARDYWAKKLPDATFEIFDVHADDLPVVIDWDQWRFDKAPSDKTLSGVHDKYGARNPRFFMRDCETAATPIETEGR